MMLDKIPGRLNNGSSATPAPSKMKSEGSGSIPICMDAKEGGAGNLEGCGRR
jgi:hypothetical protein